jgi:hypothetical protein
MSPNGAHYGDQTEHKGNERKDDRQEALDATTCQPINAESWEWVSSQREQEVNRPTDLRETSSPVE